LRLESVPKEEVEMSTLRTALVLATIGLAPTCVEPRVGEVSEALTNSHPIEGYADKISAYPGDTIQLSVHVPTGSSQFTFRILRFGPSDGSGNSQPAQILGSQGPFTATQQSYPSNAAQVGAGWAVTTSFVVSNLWQSGIHAVELTDSTTGATSHIPFIVKSSPLARAPIILVASTNTWTAYNFWPYDPAATYLSIYPGCGIPNCNSSASSSVSFARPNPNASPLVSDVACPSMCSATPYLSYFDRTEHLAAGDIRIAQWLEAVTQSKPQAYAYSVISDSDLDAAWSNGALDTTVLDPNVSPTVIISTHSEYWSANMQQAILAYASSGGNLVTLSGNTMFHTVTLGGGQLNKTTDWSRPQRTTVTGLGGPGSSGSSNCLPFTVTSPKHWAFGTANPTTLGGNGMVGVVGAPPNGEGAGTRSYCSNTAGPAAGWETDSRPASGADGALTRTYNQIATASLVAGPADMVYGRRSAGMGTGSSYKGGSAGQFFSAGSIEFGQSLLWDAFQANASLTPILRTVLGRFAHPTFGDFTSDARPDVLALDGAGHLHLYSGNGAGGFVQNGGPIFNSGWGGFTALVSVGDFDGDDKSDLLARDVNGNMLLYRGNGAGNFYNGSTLAAVGGWNAFNLIIGVGDWDDDGNPDVLARDGLGQLHLFSGNGAGTFIPNGGPVIDSGWGGFDTIIPIGDFDSDGNADVLARSGSTMTFYRGNGTGGFLQGGISLGVGSQGQTFNCFDLFIPVGDFDSDGLGGDMLARATNAGGCTTTAGTLYLFRGTGQGAFMLPAVAADANWGGYLTLLGVW
jgi:hypothetical protein